MRLQAGPVAAFILLGDSTLSCSLLDSGVEWREGDYALLWIDIPDDVSLDYSEDGKGWSRLVDKRVLAAGSNQHFIAAKQHPDGDKSQTRFYLIDKSKDEFHRVDGPMSEAGPMERASEVDLPRFSKILEPLQ